MFKYGVFCSPYFLVFGLNTGIYWLGKLCIWTFFAQSEIQHFETPIKKNFKFKSNLKGKVKSSVAYTLFALQKVPKLWAYFDENRELHTWRKCEHYKQMKQCQVRQSESEILCKNHPYRLQSRCLLFALVDRGNMLFAYLGWQNQNKNGCENHGLSKHGLI